jgi:TolB protein
VSQAEGAYIGEAAMTIESNWAYSEQLAGGGSERSVLLGVKVLANGEIADVWYDQKSGNRYLDEAARKAVLKSNPLPPFPPGNSKEPHEVRPAVHARGPFLIETHRLPTHRLRWPGRPLHSEGDHSMMRKTLLAVVICLLAVCGTVNGQDYGYVDLKNPFLKKIPLAVPPFKALTGTADERLEAANAARLLAETLSFSGYFKLLDPSAYLADADNPNIAAPDIEFANWTGIGAELLVTGGYLQSGDMVEMELRLYDTFKERLLVGKRYKGWHADQRRMIRRFCGEVVFYLTGSYGVFNSQIAFVSTGTGQKEIYICDFDGHAPRQFTTHNDISLFPDWSSDGRWLAYTSYVKGKPDLFIRNIKEKRGAIVAKEGINSTPAWLPGRFELAATLSFSGDPEIYLLTGRGKIIRRLTKNRGIDSSPSWSPDGKKMAFVSKRRGSPQIYVQDAESGDVRRLTFEGRYNTQPAWSPKGDRIAFTAMEKGRINIRTIGTDGKGLVQLTDSEGDNEAPTWSPDGSMIAFSSTREGPSRIFVMTAYGTDQRRLLTLPGQQSNPSWSPGLID